MFYFLVIVTCALFVCFFICYRQKKQKKESLILKDKSKSVDVAVDANITIDANAEIDAKISAENINIGDDTLSKLNEYIEIINCRHEFTLVSRKYYDLICSVAAMQSVVGRNPSHFKEVLAWRDSVSYANTEDTEKTEKAIKDNEKQCKSVRFGISLEDIDPDTLNIISKSTKPYEKIIDREFELLNTVYDIQKLKSTCDKVNSDFTKEIRRLNQVLRITKTRKNFCGEFLFWCCFLS